MTHVAVENHRLFAGKIHEFDWAMASIATLDYEGTYNLSVSVAYHDVRLWGPDISQLVGSSLFHANMATKALEA